MVVVMTTMTVTSNDDYDGEDDAGVEGSEGDEVEISVGIVPGPQHKKSRNPSTA